MGTTEKEVKSISAQKALITAAVGILIGLIVFFLVHVFTGQIVDRMEAEEAGDPAGCDASPPTETEGCVDNSLSLLILGFLPIFFLIAILVGAAALAYKQA